MYDRPITNGERVLLVDIFGWTLPYDDLVIDINVEDFMGANNSFTPAGVPLMSRMKWHGDYSANIDFNDKATFIHEITHVWQYYHGISIGMGFVSTLVGSWLDYSSGYDYALEPGVMDFTLYNIEQQASIVADYWLKTNDHPTIHNVRADSDLDDYRTYIYQVANSGSPSSHPVLSQLLAPL